MGGVMARQWHEIVGNIIETLRVNMPIHPELKPLFTSCVNFDRKYCDGRLLKPAKQERRPVVERAPQL